MRTINIVLTVMQKVIKILKFAFIIIAIHCIFNFQYCVDESLYHIFMIKNSVFSMYALIRSNTSVSIWLAHDRPNIFVDIIECYGAVLVCLNLFFLSQFCSLFLHMNVWFFFFAAHLCAHTRTGPRWASWNLGVFLCIRCAGIHRNLGVHISRVKSVNLDSWTPEQVVSLQQMGNSRARAVYEAQLPDGFRRPQTDSTLESFIRAKYEHKKYVAREWVQPPPPKVDWDREIDEELEKQKRKKKGLSLSTTLPSSTPVESKKPLSIKSTPIPAPLRKPTVSCCDLHCTDAIRMFTN